MKNKFTIFILYFCLTINLYSDDLFIEARNITINKSLNTSIFEKDVSIETAHKKISSQFAEYNKNTQIVVLKDSISAVDKLNNTVKSNYAEYNNIKELFKTTGKTTLTTSENYSLDGEDIYFDNKNKIIKSQKSAILKDLSGNEIYFENFEYLINENIFKSIGLIKITDQYNNTYKFSQIYIDTKKREVLGTDIKAFLNDNDFKINSKNNPRIFANTLKLNDKGSSFNKSIFTLCELKENEKCPPWILQSKRMTHDNRKKTVYYDNAVVKIYNIPIFYFPYLSHPDPSVERRSGLLPPTLYDSKNLGSGVSIPYFWAMNNDKNFTITSRLFVDENPLFLGEYHQVFKNSNFMTDFGHTEGYKKTSDTKKAGSKSHFFTKFTKNFKSILDADNTLSLIVQNVSDDKYLKLYKIKSNLVDYNKDNLENSLNYTYSNEDLFIGFNASVYETLKDNYNDKYEYILPEITLDKNILSNEKFGNLDLQTNIKVHNYETNKFTSFFVNDFEWSSNDIILNSKIKNKFLAKFKNINYEARNIDIYKDDPTNELHGAIGLFSEIDFQKKRNNFTHLLTPKLLLKLSPGNMRKENGGVRLTPINAFNLERLNKINNFETGNTATLGFDLNIKEEDTEKFNFSVAQIINEVENKKIGSKTSLDEKLSDLVGTTSYNINERIKLTYNFSVDQNYQELNYNDFGSNFKFDNMNIDFNYIEEDKHIGNQEYFKTKVSYKNKDKSLISFETKRNLITNSSEFYDLSYEYINDCLRAGLVYRREFYNDSELEAENSLMFNITLTPFGNINSPKFNK